MAGIVYGGRQAEEQACISMSLSIHGKGSESLAGIQAAMACCIRHTQAHGSLQVIAAGIWAGRVGESVQQFGMLGRQVAAPIVPCRSLPGHRNRCSVIAYNGMGRRMLWKAVLLQVAVHILPVYGKGLAHTTHTHMVRPGCPGRILVEAGSAGVQVNPKPITTPSLV